MPVIAPDNEPVIAAMLRLPKRDARWWLEQWQARQQCIDARYRARGGPWAIVRLVDRQRRVPARLPQRRTEHFLLVVMRSSAGADVDALLTILATQVRTHEQDFRWAEPRPSPGPDPLTLALDSVPVERLALEAGVKPALRLRLHPWEAPYEAGLWLRAGFALSAIETDAGADGARTYLMIARERACVDALTDAELRQYQAMPAQLDALRECGQLLGYPPCCVDAFLRSTQLERGDDPELDARRCNFHRLDQAWVPAPHRLLNTLRQHEGIGLISFDPCSFTCPAALETATRIAAVAEAARPGYCAALCGAFAINLADDRVGLELDRARLDGPGARIVGARATRANAEGFARRLVGQHVDAEGRIPGLDEACRVFVFA